MSTLLNPNAGELITRVLLISVTLSDTMAEGMEADLPCLKMTFWSLPNLSRSDPERREKINLDFYFA